MKKKILTFMLLLVVAGILMLVGHEISSHIKSEKKEKTTAEATMELDASLYYTYADVENTISYLADTTEESQALSRLIDPLKKSEQIDVAFIKSVVAVIQAKDIVYAEVLSDKADTEYVTKEEFETIYENIVASAAVKGLLRKDVLVLELSEDKKSFYDGHEMYYAELVLKDSYEGSVLDVYMKNGKIFKINGLGNSQITLSGVWVTAIEEERCSFRYGQLQRTCLVREEANVQPLETQVATSLDAERKTDAGYETEGFVANLVFDYSGICRMESPKKVLRGKVLSTGETDIQIENIGGLTLAEDYKIYNVYEEVVAEESLSLLTGYSYVDCYIQEGTISAIVISQELKSEDIRVIISNEDTSSYEMETVQLTASSDYTVKYPDDTKKQYKAGETLVFYPDEYEPEACITITPDTHSGRIRLLSVTRECGNPEYDGMIELNVFDGFFYVINEVSLERYLENVVANAMPSDYPDAAMQAMAICARGAAYAKLKDESYAEYHAHLDDSSLCQVYNNVPATEASIRAVKDTYGLVPTYRGTLIVPMTFNTSFGMTCTNAEIWGGDAYSYLESNVETIEKNRIDLSEEAAFAAFLEDSGGYDIIDSTAPFYRWEIAFTQEEMTTAIATVLEERKSLMENAILVEDENGEFVKADKIEVGVVESVEVTERSSSGVVSTLVIRGSEQTISVSGQSNIRALLTPVKQEIIRQDNTTLTGWTSLPSPYYYVEKTETGFLVHGGGFGHGAGMSLYGAGVLGRQGKSYKYILRHYFSYIDFASIYKMDEAVPETDGE